MIRALPYAQLIAILAALAIGTFLVICAARHRRWAQLIADRTIGQLAREAFSTATAAISFVGILLPVLDYTGGWRLAWIPNRWVDLNTLVFPDLTGTWTGVLSSNRNNEGAGDGKCPWLGQSKDIESGCYKVEMTISMGLFDTDVDFKLQDARSVSKGVSLTRNGSHYEMMYLFVRTRPGQDPFNGAADLQVHIGDQSLEGHYWTDRDWRTEKLQTAGFVVVTKAGPKAGLQASR